ncbi:MAG: hybrid sensor histidine kinase/response regulator, partial [Chloroflexia bacterium]
TMSHPGTSGQANAPFLAEYSKPCERLRLAVPGGVELEALRLGQETPDRIFRAFRTLTECNRVLVQAADEESLLQAFCRTLVQVGGYRLAWIGVAREDKTVTPVAQAGFEEGYLTSVHITWDESDYGRGSTGTAIRTGQPCIARDIPSDLHYAPWRAKALRWGYMSSIALPIFLNGRVYGALNIYAEEPDAFGEIEVRLLSNLAEDLAYGISALRTSAEHREAGVERSRLLARLCEQAHQMQRIVDAVPEGVILLDEEHRIALANPAARAYLRALSGADVGQVLTRLGDVPLEEILTPQDGGKEVHEVTTNGSARRTFEVSAQTVEDGSSMGGWVLVIREVTRQREEQARLAQQQRLAAMGQLAAGIAHDLNNVLQGILSFADLLRQEPGLPDSAQEPLRLIMQLAERAARVNRQILDFTRQSVSEKHPLNLVPFAREIVYLLQRMIPENIRVSLEYASGEYWVNADVAQLQQVLINLATNARDAMPEGGHLTIRLTRHDLLEGAQFPGFRLPAGNWVRLEISDTGQGIAPEILPRVFEPFFTTKERGQGTGLGLAQVYGIVKQHDGHIDITSQVGKGTTVAIYLPALPDEPKEDLRLRSKEGIPRGKGELVLLVEDDPAVLEAARAALERLNYQVLAASDGRQALELFRQHRHEIALVIADLVMPGLGGIALCQALRAINPCVRVLLLSGYPLGAQTSLLSPHGVVGWLQKPVDLEGLAWALRRALAEKSSTG